MKKIMVLLAFCILSTVVCAHHNPNVVLNEDGKWIRYDVDINNTAHMIKKQAENWSIDNSRLISDYVENNIRYDFGRYARDQSSVWILKRGDCTDRAILKCNMMRNIGIPCRLVHGYAYNGHEGNGTTYYNWHDWYEYKDSDGEWKTYEAEKWYLLKREGLGVW